jgi:hypothetical protein
LIVARPFMPESPRWREQRTVGRLQRPRIADVFGPGLRRTTIVTTIMVTCGYAISFGANLQLPRIVPGLAEVEAMSRTAREQTIGLVQFLQESGGFAGRLLLAALAPLAIARRRLIRIFLVPAVAVVPLVFFVAAAHSVRAVEIGTFVAGLLTVAQFSFWGNYLPRVYPTRLRGTGESVAINIGGRMIGTGGALATTVLAAAMPGRSPFARLASAAGLVGVVSVLIALVASAWLPEPAGSELPD